MKGDLIKILGILAIVAILVSFILAVLGMIGSAKLADGCFMRYGDSDSPPGTSDSIRNTVMLDATGNYTAQANQVAGKSQTMALEYDPKHYGEWLNVGLSVTENQKVKFLIEGEISLCRAYIPENNLYLPNPSVLDTHGKPSNLDTYGNLIPIPRIEEDDAEPISLIFDAKIDEWRNITELYTNDRVVVSVLPNQQPNKDAPNTIEVQNVFIPGSSGRVVEDCSQGEISYLPVCGRYSIYSGQYVSDCEWKDDYDNGPEIRHCPSWASSSTRQAPCGLGCVEPPSHGGFNWKCIPAGVCCAKYTCSRVGAWLNVMKPSPEPYEDKGRFTFPSKQYENIKDAKDIEQLYTNFQLECSKNADKPPSLTCSGSGVDRSEKYRKFIQSDDYKNTRYFWFAAPTGLVERIDNNKNPTDAKSLGSNYKIVQVIKDNEFYKVLNSSRSENQKYQVICDQVIPFNKYRAVSYLQYRFWSHSNDYSKNTGGYVLNLKHTKCRRTNGNSFSDLVKDRGKIEFLIVAGGEDPNQSGSYTSYEIKPADAQGNAEITMREAGAVWMRIFNKVEDYPESYGKYRVQMFTSKTVESFTSKILTPLFVLLKDKVIDASETVFQNMTCYHGDKTNCTNFFTYIRAVLILYVMTYGAMFLLGIVKLNQQDLLIRIAKIALVSGLMNENTFNFFQSYIFKLITDFSDGIISNMSGYSMFTMTGRIANPFMFLDAVMTKILLGKTFSAQLFSFISMGFSGLIYFVITFIAVAIVVITALRAIAVYIMAFMANAVLIGIAPLFLTFMLFDFTRYLFENWVRFTIRYMIEPVILMAGIIIMTQLFTIYLDFALGFSVCWKCALPIKFPIPNIGGFTPEFLNVPLFCISWFAPWGMDYHSGMMGVNMQHFIALIIIAYGMYGYVEFSGRMVAKLSEGGGPLATSMGNNMSSSIGQGALGKVGLDKKTRGEISHAASDRLKARNKALDQANKARKKLNTDKGTQGAKAEGEGASNE